MSGGVLVFILAIIAFPVLGGIILIPAMKYLCLAPIIWFILVVIGTVLGSED